MNSIPAQMYLTITSDCVTTDVQGKGFRQCQWDVTSRQAAHELAHALSIEHEESHIYENPFWVNNEGRYWHGTWYPKGTTV